MNRLAVSVLLVVLADFSAAGAESPAEALSHATSLRESGDFKGAAAVLGEALRTPDLSGERRKELEFQLDVLGRIKLDYTLTREHLRAQLAAGLRGLTADEFKQWLGQGWFDGQTIDSETLYVSDSVRNLFFQHPELRGRRVFAGDEDSRQRGRLKVCREIKQAALAQKTPYVLPHTFLCTMWVTAEPGAAPPGALVRAWLPIPRHYPFQEEFKVLQTSSPVKNLAPESSPIRSAYFEQPAEADGSARFLITYSYTACGVYFDMNPAQSRPVAAQDPVFQFTSEAPHIVFTDKIRELADKITGSESNPMIEAKAFYDWVGLHIKFSYAREYSTLTNMSDYCLSRGCGDCGQEAFLFMTLCRCRGIPARWQSGWNTFPGGRSNHDWCEIYLTPYGWVPVDPWAGIYALQYCPALSAAERRELHDFYFGGLDYYRMASNSDHNQLLDPPKLSLRSDNVDFQRGELEWGTNNIYFDKFSYALQVHE